MNLKQRIYRLFCAILVCSAAVFGLNSSALAAHIWYVDATVADCDNEGDSWANAFKYLQDGLDAAGLDDQIWVRAGTYQVDQSCANETGSGQRAETFQLIKGVFLLGGFNGTETLPEQRDPVNNETFLSGVLGDVAPVDLCGGPFKECGNSGGDCFEPHGGLGCENSRCCQIVCDMDPACCCIAWDQHCVDAALENCGDAYHVVTAGSQIDDPEQTVIDGFTISDGTATSSLNDRDHGGGMLIEGEPSVIRCIFTQNTATARGGGMSIIGDFNRPWIINCIFEANPGGQPWTPTIGGGLASSNADPILTNCLFVDNAAEQDGGGIFSGAAVCQQGACDRITLVNCTLVSNTADANNSGSGLDGGLYAGGNGGIVTVDNSIFWGNSPDQIEGVGSTVFQINYSDCGGGCPGTGDDNINLDPQFVNEPGDLRLTINSPCIDDGNPIDSIIPDDIFDLDDDDDTLEATPDLDLFNRVLDGNDDTEILVDMGAYEFIHPDICPWDLNDNCRVGVGDLLILLANWANPYGVPELLELLAAWGPCPQCSIEPLSLAEELADACLTQDDWDEYEDVMTDPLSSQADKDRYDCWMTHYIQHCDKCTCQDIPTCPSPDPFN